MEFKESSSQGPLEAWAVKLAFKRWGTKLKDKSVVLRSDSVVALAMAKRLSSPSPVINWVGAELAIRCDKHGIKWRQTGCLDPTKGAQRSRRGWRRCPSRRSQGT